MKKYKAAYFLSMLIFACLVTVGKAAAPKPDTEVFYPAFPLNRHAMGNINCYRIKYARTGEETAQYYAGLFDLPPAYTIDEDGYRFEGEAGTLVVYRHAQQFVFTPREPLEMAPEQFFESVGLELAYEEMRVGYDGKLYTITFAGYLDNLLDYSFVPTVLMNHDGHIIQAEYFFMEYVKLGGCRIQSLRDAFAELPCNDGGIINLTEGRLVYSYQNSVVQPAYFFEGEDERGNTVEYFVKAAVY